MSRVGNHSTQPRLRSVRYRLTQDVSTPSSSVQGRKRQVMPFTISTKNSSRTATMKLPRALNSQYSSVGGEKDLMFSSVVNTECPEQRSQNRHSSRLSAHENIFRRTNCTETFNIMMGMDRSRAKTKCLDIGIESFGHISRVQLPNLKQMDSQFNLLDHVNLPIGFIQQQISRVQKQIALSGEEKQCLRANLNQMHDKFTKQIQEIQKQSLGTLDRLKRILKSNKICQQESLLSLKNSLMSCHDYLPKFHEQLDQSKERLVNLQDEIFKDLPFELQPVEVGVMENDYF